MKQASASLHLDSSALAFPTCPQEDFFHEFATVGVSEYRSAAAHRVKMLCSDIRKFRQRGKPAVAIIGCQTWRSGPSYVSTVLRLKPKLSKEAPTQVGCSAGGQ